MKQFRALNNTILMPKENQDQFILSTRVLLMKENGLEVSEMDMEHRNGVMELFMLGNGIIIELKVKENSFILMVTSMKVIG